MWYVRICPNFSIFIMAQKSLKGDKKSEGKVARGSIWKMGLGFTNR